MYNTGCCPVTLVAGLALLFISLLLCRAKKSHRTDTRRMPSATASSRDAQCGDCVACLGNKYVPCSLFILTLICDRAKGARSMSSIARNSEETPLLGTSLQLLPPPTSKSYTSYRVLSLVSIQDCLSHANQAPNSPRSSQNASAMLLHWLNEDKKKDLPANEWLLNT